ncbi:hypothetical protein DL98DRAFT_519427 [Cadophora sp. DSE1049]|nr:hypothetical protein DL98DRAFT_519427 [Cadophora sp. DSE1049]
MDFPTTPTFSPLPAMPIPGTGTPEGTTTHYRTMVCCSCGHNVNIIWSGSCPACGHERCGACDIKNRARASGMDSLSAPNTPTIPTISMPGMLGILGMTGTADRTKTCNRTMVCCSCGHNTNMMWSSSCAACGHERCGTCDVM